MRYILGVLGLVLLAVFAIFLLATGGNDRTDRQEGERVVTLTDYADKSSAVSLTEDGRITGLDTHKSVRITVTPSERKVELLTGYDGSVERSQTFSNTSEAYEEFVFALHNAGFSRERDTAITDERGVCPQGSRYIYSLSEGDEEPIRLWSTSCSGKQGTFGGDTGLVRRIFHDQITDYNTFVRGVRL